LRSSVKDNAEKVQQTESRLASVMAELDAANTDKAALLEENALLESSKEANEEHLERLVCS
jgi:uncharacterized protein YaaN involved in tellurite resistance